MDRVYLRSLVRTELRVFTGVLTFLFRSGDVGTGAYCAAKYAMRGMSQSLHRELQTISPNLRSVIFEPGAVRTPVLLSSRLVLGKRRIDDYSTVTKQYKNLHHSESIFVLESILVVNRSIQVLEEPKLAIPTSSVRS